MVSIMAAVGALAMLWLATGLTSLSSFCIPTDSMLPP